MTINEIKEKNLNCVVKVDSEEEAIQLAEMFDSNDHDVVWMCNYIRNTYDKADGTVCFTIEDNKIEGVGTETYFKTKGKGYGIIYNFKDLVQIGGVITRDNGKIFLTNGMAINVSGVTIKTDKSAYDMIDSLIDSYRAVGCCRTKSTPKTTQENKGEKEMEVFGTVCGKRINKTCNEWIDIITTYAYNGVYSDTTTCDKENYDGYTGALIASAKITAHHSKDAMRFYKLAMSMWKDDNEIPDSTIAILKILADEAFNGEFEKKYKQWQNELVRNAKNKIEKELRCSVCGKKFDTPEDARAHEKWHIENKKARRQRYLERKEARDRLAEKEREKRIDEYMKELAIDNQVKEIEK